MQLTCVRGLRFWGYRLYSSFFLRDTGLRALGVASWDLEVRPWASLTE